MCCRICTLHVLLTAICLSSSALVHGEDARSQDRLQPVGHRQVKLCGELGRRIDLTIRGNLLKLDVDKDFLKPFQDRKEQGGFIGLGMLIDATVRLALYTGDPKLVALKSHLVDETIKTQASDGYIGMMTPEKRMWKLWDLADMNFLVYGLLSDYRLFGEKPSLAAARKLADYILARWAAEPQGDPTEGGITVDMALVGLERTFLVLSDVTGDARYRDFCLSKRKLREWNRPIAIGRWGHIEGHAYTFLELCLAQLYLNREQPGESLLGPTRRMIEFLTRGDGLTVIGSCGDHECWHDTQSGTINLGETCAAACLVRVLDELMRQEGSSRCGDLMERTIYNALFAAQSTDGRKIRYYTPFDGPRQYWPVDSYCCPNNFRRFISDLPTFVYYRAGKGVAVNLYTASSAKLELDDGLSLAVRQETDYPTSGNVTIGLEPSKPATFPLLVRIPRWCSGARVLVSGKVVEKAAPAGAFYTIERTWNRGDQVQLEMPMPLRLVKGRRTQAGRIAVLRGPLVLCLSRDQQESLKTPDLRLLTLQPSSLQGPVSDPTVRPDGLACKARFWAPGAWYPAEPPALELKLTEFADPAGEATYFHVPNPNAAEFVDDELIIKK
jgi:uncharacterized protein